MLVTTKKASGSSQIAGQNLPQASIVGAQSPHHRSPQPLLLDVGHLVLYGCCIVKGDESPAAGLPGIGGLPHGVIIDLQEGKAVIWPRSTHG